MPILTLILVGLAAGVLAAMLVGGYGLLANIVVGIAGSFVGSWLFREAGWHAPFEGLASTIFVAFIGAVGLLLVLRLISGARGGGWRPRR